MKRRWKEISEASFFVPDVNTLLSIHNIFTEYLCLFHPLIPESSQIKNNIKDSIEGYRYLNLERRR
jgi:hypothetical protein